MAPLHRLTMNPLVAEAEEAVDIQKEDLADLVVQAEADTLMTIMFQKLVVPMVDWRHGRVNYKILVTVVEVQ
jgi:hypothetical protein